MSVATQNLINGMHFSREMDDLHSRKKPEAIGRRGYRTVRDGEGEQMVPCCPAFAESEEKVLVVLTSHRWE